MKQIYTTTLRLNLANEDDRKAYEYLKHLNKQQYRSSNKAIVAAINSYFDRQERLAADPYLETREKEDAFLQKVLETVQAGASSFRLPFSVQSNLSAQNAPVSSDEDVSAALDFADSF